MQITNKLNLNIQCWTASGKDISKVVKPWKTETIIEDGSTKVTCNLGGQNNIAFTKSQGWSNKITGSTDINATCYESDDLCACTIEKSTTE